MPPTDDTLTKVLKAVDDAERERAPASPELIAEKCGLDVQEVKERMAEARSLDLAYYYNSTEETSLPTAPGWTLTPKGQALIEGISE